MKSISVVPFKGTKAILIAQESMALSCCASTVYQTLYVNNSLIKAEFYSKCDASGYVFDLKNVTVLSKKCSIPEFDDILAKC